MSAPTPLWRYAAAALALCAFTAAGTSYVDRPAKIHPTTTIQEHTTP